MGSDHSTLSSTSSNNPISYRCVSSRPNYYTELLKRLPLLHILNSAHSASELTSAIGEIIHLDDQSYRCEELRDLLVEKRADAFLEIEEEEQEETEAQKNIKNQTEVNSEDRGSEKGAINLRKTTNALVASIGNLLLWFIPEGGNEFELGQKICSTPQVVSFVVKLLSLFRHLQPKTVGILADCVCCITAGNAEGRRLFSESGNSDRTAFTPASQILVGALEFSVKLLRDYYGYCEDSSLNINSSSLAASVPVVIESIQLLCGAIGNITFKNYVAKQMFASIPDCIPSLIEALEVVRKHHHHHHDESENGENAHLHENDDDLISHTIQFIATAIANIATNPTAKETLSSKNENFAKILLASFSCATTPESVGWIASAIHNIIRENTEEGKRFFSSKDALEIMFRVLMESATTQESCQWVCTCIYNILLENINSEGAKSLLMLHQRDETNNSGAKSNEMDCASSSSHVLHYYFVVKSLLICLNDRTKNSPDCVLAVCRTLHYILIIGLENHVFSKCVLPKKIQNNSNVRDYDEDDYVGRGHPKRNQNHHPSSKMAAPPLRPILASPRQTFESIHDEYEEFSSPFSATSSPEQNKGNNNPSHGDMKSEEDLQDDAFSAESLASLLSSPLCVMAFVSAIKNAKKDSRAADHVWSLLFFILNEMKPTSVEAFGSSYFLRRVEGSTNFDDDDEKDVSVDSKEFHRIYKHSLDDDEKDVIGTSSSRKNRVYHQKESEDYINVVKILSEEIERKKEKNLLAQAELHMLNWVQRDLQKFANKNNKTDGNDDHQNLLLQGLDEERKNADGRLAETNIKGGTNLHEM